MVHTGDPVMLLIVTLVGAAAAATPVVLCPFSKSMFIR
jgi:hypothetical protein